MEYRSLGCTGVMVSPIGLGTDNFGDATSAAVAEKIINRALDKGINLIDTGDVYCEGESERIIGRTIKKNKKRDQVIIAAPPVVGYLVALITGWFVGDVFLTWDEIKGLMAGTLAVDTPPAGSTKLTAWAKKHADTLGREYTSELARRKNRVQAYRSN